MSGASQDDIRLKRARMRAWRRGMKEMDLLLGTYIDRHGETLSEEAMTVFEALLDRPDQLLYAWASNGESHAPDDASPAERALLARIGADYST